MSVEATGQEPETGCLKWFIILSVLGVIGYSVYDSLDKKGLVSHEREATITAESNWFVGESKTCESDMRTTRDMAEDPRSNTQQFGYALAFLRCDGGPPHAVRIRFWGREVQPEYSAVQWRCTREEFGFTCVQISGTLRPR